MSTNEEREVIKEVELTKEEPKEELKIETKAETETKDVKAIDKVKLKMILGEDKTVKFLENLVGYEELKTRYEVMKKEREIDEARLRELKHGLICAAFAISTIISVALSEVDSNKVINDELRALRSWEAVPEYFEDIGPLTTVLGIGTGVSLYKVCKCKRLVKKREEEYSDYVDEYNSLFSFYEEDKE